MKYKFSFSAILPNRVTRRSIMPDLRTPWMKPIGKSGHVHVGEICRSLSLLQDLFNSDYLIARLFESASIETSATSSKLEALRGNPDEIWRIYLDRFAYQGLAVSPLFLDSEKCFVCAWLSGDEEIAPFFDSKYYSLRNIDVVIEQPDYLSHWFLHGLRDGRHPSSVLKISPRWMEMQSPDVLLSQFPNTSAFLRTIFETGSQHRLDALLHSFYKMSGCSCENNSRLLNQKWCSLTVDRVIWGS